MDEETGKSLTRREFEAVIKRASELATSDPYGEEGALNEAELFRIAREVGLPDAHVRRALSEVRTREDPKGVVDRWFGSVGVRVSRVVPGEKAKLRALIDEFLVAGHLLQPIRQGTDVLLYRPAVDWISSFARAGASMSQRVYWAAAKEIQVCLSEVAAGVARITGHYSRKRRGEVRQELEGILDRLERGEDLSPPPASWRRWVKRRAKRFKVEMSDGDYEP